MTPNLQRALGSFEEILGSFRRRPVLIAIVVTVLSVCASTIVFGTALGLTNFRDVGYPDSATLLRVGELVRSHHIYSDGDRPPYFISLYGPLTYVYLAIPYKLALTLHVAPQTLVRLAVLLAVLVCVGCVFQIGRRLYGSRGMAFLSALFAVSAYPMASWTTQIRSDFLALACSLGAILWFLRTNEQKLSSGSAVLAGVALLFKQTFIAAPLAIVGWLLYRRRDKDAILWSVDAGMTVIVGNGITFLCEPFMQKTLADIHHPVFEFRGALSYAWMALLQPVVPFMFLGALVVIRERAPDRLLLLFYTVTSWILAFITIPQAGGNINYFWEPLMVSGVLAAVGLTELQRYSARSPALAAIAFCALVVRLAAPAMQPVFGTLSYEYGQARQYSAEKRQWLAFTSAVAGRRLLSTHPDITILSSVPEIPDGYLNDVLETRGRWDSRPVVDELNADTFDLIVITRGQAEAAILESHTKKRQWRQLLQWDTAMWNAVEQNYQMSCTFDVFEVWTPKRDTANRAPINYGSFGCSPAIAVAQSASRGSGN